MSNVASDRKGLSRSSIIGEDPVIDGTVDSYDFDWGEPVNTRAVDVWGGCNCHLNEEPVQEMEAGPKQKTYCACESPIEKAAEKVSVPMEESTEKSEYEIVDL